MALADDIALYAYGYWTHEQHPFRINSICLNTIQRKNPCTACTDSCPAGIVLHSGKADWTGCTNCNLCVTACPTAAINQSSTSFAHIRRLITEDSAPVSFACERVEENSDVRCVCLAAIPWDLTAAAALAGGVVLKVDACKSCPHAAHVERVKDLIKTVRQFLGRERFNKCVYMHDQHDKLRKPGSDKRIAFNKVAGSVTQGAETALEGEKVPTMSCYRALLLDILTQQAAQGTPVDVCWPTLIEDGTCRACEICTKLCPHHALELRIPGYTETEDGEGQFLVHDASKCTQCGLCYLTCPIENLSGWDKLHSSAIPAIQTYPLEVALCEKCKRPFKPQSESDTICAICNKPKLGFGR